MRLTGIAYTTIYSIVVILFGNFYKILAARRTDEENHRYQKQHTDELIRRLFQFNFINFYFPMLWVAFDARNNRRYTDLFNLMLVQMAVKQVSFNVIEYFQPIMKAKSKLDELKIKYMSVIDRFVDIDSDKYLDRSHYVSDPNFE